MAEKTQELQALTEKHGTIENLRRKEREATVAAAKAKDTLHRAEMEAARITARAQAAASDMWAKAKTEAGEARKKIVERERASEEGAREMAAEFKAQAAEMDREAEDLAKRTDAMDRAEKTLERRAKAVEIEMSRAKAMQADLQAKATALQNAIKGLV